MLQKLKEIYQLKINTDFIKIKAAGNNLEGNNTSILNAQKKNKQKIIDYIFFAKIISSYGVVVLHLNHFLSFNQKKEKKCIIENIYETAFYYSVPFFVLCIGVTLLDFNERYGLLEYNKKRIIYKFNKYKYWKNYWN